MHIVSLNARLIEATDARIAIDERGFRFGDGLFETIPVHNGAPYLLRYHLERLQAGLKAIAILYDVSVLPALLQQVLNANKAVSCVARIYISRGVGSQGYLPFLPASEPTQLIQLLPMPQTPQAPVSLWLSQWEKTSPRALPTHFKLAQGLNSTLARMEAREQGHYDALQLSALGYVSEAGSANIFWVKNDAVFTPALTTGALAGVTRRRLMELAPQTVSEGEYTLDHLREAQGVFLTNATLGIVAVNALEPLGFAWQSDKVCTSFAALRAHDSAGAF